ncbi:MAG: energy-coupling factor ABC transporter permease, partial [Candidatus Eisenbacteria bacterium]
LMGVMAAFIFAAQMINFPVAGGTSGHLLGGAIAAALLGPYGGCLAMTVVLIVQCLVFQDGGITTLGAHILNMAVAGTAGVYPIMRLAAHAATRRTTVIIAASFAAWVSVVVASLLCALELAWSGVARAEIVVPAMTVVHALIGIVEAIVTGFFIAFLLRTRPDLVVVAGKSRPLI